MFRGKRNSFGKLKQIKDKIDAIGSQLLEVCRRSPGNLQRIKDLVESCPEAATQYKDGDERTALHHLCSNQAPLSVVEFIVQKFPNPAEACQLVTSKGMLPLHYACRDRSTLDVIQFLLAGNPTGVKMPNSSGWLPLHLACARKASAEIVQLLIQQWPESVQQPTPEGRVALHFACANHAPIAVLELLVKRGKQALTLKDKEEWTPLHIACAYSHSFQVVQLLVTAWEEGLHMSGKQGRLPLHVACFEGKSVEIVKYLVGKWPKSLRLHDQNGFLPLHLACKGNADLIVIKHLILQAPSTAFEIGRTPHEIASYISSKGGSVDVPQPPPELVNWVNRNVQVSPQPQQAAQAFQRALINSRAVPSHTVESPGVSRPRTTTVPQSPRVDLPVLPTGRINGNLSEEQFVPPPHLMNNTSHGSMNDELPQLIDGLLQGTKPANQVSEDSQEVRSAGQRLHLACEAPQALDVIKKLLQVVPAAARYRTYGQLCPIHTACLNQAPVEVLQCIYGQYPDCVRQRDEEGNLPIHLACFSASSLNSIAYLVDMWPQSLKETNNRGETPLHRAKQPFLDKPDPEVIACLDGRMQRLQASTPVGGDIQVTPPIDCNDIRVPSPQMHAPATGFIPVSPFNQARRRQNPLARNGDIPASPFNMPRPIATKPVVAPGTPSSKEKRSIGIPPPMGVHELRNTLDAMRATRKPANGTQPSTHDESPETSTHSHVALLSPKPPLKQQRGNIPESPGPRKPPLLEPRLNTNGRSQSPAPRRAASPVVVTGGGTPNRQMESPGRMGVPSPGRIFAGWASRSGSPLPAIRLPFGGGGQSSQPPSPGGRRSARNSNASQSTEEASEIIDAACHVDRIDDVLTRCVVTSNNRGGNIPGNGMVNSNLQRPTTPASGETTRPAQTPQGGGTASRSNNMASRFEAPIIVEAGYLAERISRPGAIAVNEPVVRPDSALARVRLQTASRGSGDIPTSVENSPSNHSRSSLARDGNTGGSPRPPTQASSFYRAAIEGARMMQAKGSLEGSGSSNKSPNTAALPARTSPRQDVALGEVPTRRQLTDSSNYPEPRRFRGESTGNTHQDRKPAAVAQTTEQHAAACGKKSPNNTCCAADGSDSPLWQNPANGDLRGNMIRSAVAQSSFYRTALDEAQGLVPTTTTPSRPDLYSRYRTS